MACSHKWQRQYEEFLLGGMFPIGWKCVVCGEWKDQSEITPSGLQGEVLKSAKLIGPHGCVSSTSDGRLYKEQIIHEDGSLEIIYADE